MPSRSDSSGAPFGRPWSWRVHVAPLSDVLYTAIPSSAVRLVSCSGMHHAVLGSRGWIAAAKPKCVGRPVVRYVQVVSPGSRQYTSRWTRMKRTPETRGCASSLWMQPNTSGRGVSPLVGFGAPTCVLSRVHDAPPSFVVYTPPTLMPTCILFGSAASMAIEWSPIPPKPGTHSLREG